MNNLIYYIEDDEIIADNVSNYLKTHGFKITTIQSIAIAKSLFSTQLPALCLIDWNLPDGIGEELCCWIRERYAELPIIFITVKNQVNDVVNGFHVGADDYITKPFELEILHSRITALMRRTKTTSNIVTCCDLKIDTDKYRVWLDGNEVQLSVMEYQLLILLAKNKNKTVTRKILLEKVWDINGNFVNDNTLTVTMKRLRQKLNNPESIKTIRSFGYRMEDL